MPIESLDGQVRNLPPTALRLSAEQEFYGSTLACRTPIKLVSNVKLDTAIHETDLDRQPLKTRHGCVAGLPGNMTFPPPVRTGQIHSGEHRDASDNSEPVESRCIRRLSFRRGLGWADNSLCRSERVGRHGCLWFGIGAGVWPRSVGNSRECCVFRETSRDSDGDDAKG